MGEGLTLCRDAVGVLNNPNGLGYLIRVKYVQHLFMYKLMILVEGTTPFPGLYHFTLDTYLIMLSVKQGGIKYHFSSPWYDLTWD